MYMCVCFFFLIKQNEKRTDYDVSIRCLCKIIQQKEKKRPKIMYNMHEFFRLIRKTCPFYSRKSTILIKKNKQKQETTRNTCSSICVPLFLSN